MKSCIAKRRCMRAIVGNASFQQSTHGFMRVTIVNQRTIIDAFVICLVKVITVINMKDLVEQKHMMFLNHRRVNKRPITRQCLW